MAGNSNLHDSSRNKQDEFYTNLQLIEDELDNYRAHFKGKRVLCNCDDPYESNFFKYFAMNFNSLGLKSLTATCYATSPVVFTQLDLFGKGEIVKRKNAPKRKTPYKIVITEVGDENGDGRIDLSDVEWLIRNKKNVLTELKGDGDFRSAECALLLKEADIVVTNPPFSLFREYMSLLMEHEKKFLVIGNMNAVTYKEIFALIKENKVWLGNKSGHFWFMVPSHYEAKATDFKIDENGQKRILRTVGDKWSYLERSKFNYNAQPFYVTLDNEGRPLGPSAVYKEDIDLYMKFLNTGLKNYKPSPTQ